MDSLGGKWGNSDFVSYYYAGTGKWVNTDTMGLTSDIYGVIESVVLPRVKSQIDAEVAKLVKNASSSSGGSTTSYTTSNSYSFGSVCFALGDGSVDTTSTIYYGWSEYRQDNHTYRAYSWNTDTTIIYSDIFEDPLDIGVEVGGNPFPYGHIWQESLSGSGKVLIE